MLVCSSSQPCFETSFSIASWPFHSNGLVRRLDLFVSCANDTLREITPALTRLFYSCCVVDIWRYLHLTSSSFTWNRWDGQLASRVDLVGCAYPWISSVSDCDIVPFSFSGHCALLFTLVSVVKQLLFVLTQGPWVYLFLDPQLRYLLSPNAQMIRPSLLLLMMPLTPPLRLIPSTIQVLDQN